VNAEGAALWTGYKCCCCWLGGRVNCHQHKGNARVLAVAAALAAAVPSAVAATDPISSAIQLRAAWCRQGANHGRRPSQQVQQLEQRLLLHSTAALVASAALWLRELLLLCCCSSCRCPLHHGSWRVGDRVMCCTGWLLLQLLHRCAASAEAVAMHAWVERTLLRLQLCLDA